MKQSVRHEMKQGMCIPSGQWAFHKTILQHVIRNAMFPMVTLMGHALPALLSGSLIIEVIFSIPGMGRLMYTSLLARDWPLPFRFSCSARQLLSLRTR
jgi:peptide/nickel transport system permease protein